jgi:hypothetical protein
LAKRLGGTNTLDYNAMPTKSRSTYQQVMHCDLVRIVQKRTPQHIVRNVLERAVAYIYTSAVAG